MKRKSRKQTKRRAATKAVRSGRPSLKMRTAPRTAKQYFAMSRTFQDMWDRISQVPGTMRSQGLSLTRASKQFRLDIKEVLRLAASAFRKRPDGRYVAKPIDRLLRILPIPTKKGLREIAVRDSRQASLIGDYWNAVARYLSRGDASQLRKFRGVRVTDADGKRIRLLTNLEELRRQGSAGVLRFEDLYGRVA